MFGTDHHDTPSAFNVGLVNTTYAAYTDHRGDTTLIPVDSRDPEDAIKNAPAGARTLMFYDQTSIVTEIDGKSVAQPTAHFLDPSEMYIVH